MLVFICGRWSYVKLLPRLGLQNGPTVSLRSRSKSSAACIAARASGAMDMRPQRGYHFVPTFFAVRRPAPLSGAQRIVKKKALRTTRDSSETSIMHVGHSRGLKPNWATPVNSTKSEGGWSLRSSLPQPASKVRCLSLASDCTTRRDATLRLLFSKKANRLNLSTGR